MSSTMQNALPLYYLKQLYVIGTLTQNDPGAPTASMGDQPCLTIFTCFSH